VIAQPRLLPLQGSYGLLVHAPPVQEQADLFVTAALETEALVGVSRGGMQCFGQGSRHRRVSPSQPCF
jgi:hypothetical protein